MFYRLSLTIPLLAVLCLRVPAAEPTAGQLELFENKVRPILFEQCYKCHSEKAQKVKGGLRLDTAEALAKGGDSGAVVIPGDPEASLLIKAVRYTDPDLQMPPENKKLSSEQIATLEAWVKMGAPFPHSAGGALAGTEKARAAHWAFKPPARTPTPTVKNARWPRTPVDYFVLAELERKNLKPSPEADARALIRRVSYDLTGLPPSASEVEAFVEDRSAGAYERLVDRLLKSPHYGERWGRYWLDVARYADTRGYLAGGEERRYAFSYTYRDYVIRAFNEDKPYDQFVTEQIAADLLTPAASEDKKSLAALGFLTLGRRFLNNQNDIIDDRIDLITRGTLGLTVACARCHDHKFDPISSKDYYALHGIFASSEEPAEEPLLGGLPDSAVYQEYLGEKAKIEKDIVALKEKEIAQYVDELRQHVGEYLLGAHDAANLEESEKLDTFAGERKLQLTVLKRWIAALQKRSKGPDPVFGPWFELTRGETKNLSTNQSPGPSLSSVETRVREIVTKAISVEGTNSVKAASEAYTKLFKEIDAEWKAALQESVKEKRSAPTALPLPEREMLRQVLYAEDGPGNLPKADAETILARKINEGSAPLRNKIAALGWTHPGAPARAMALFDRSNPGNSHVFVRGNPGTPGEEVPRRFLEILSNPKPSAFTKGSGRLELARAIVNPGNPLTARVYVNRVWQHHFGEGLVATPGDFGVRTPEPLHRDLLDHLAVSFMEHGWSTKFLHRQILLSATYRQSSDASPAAIKADPDNRLLSRMNRQRLDFEALRDTLLAAGGKLDERLGGLPVDITSQPFATRRTVYGLIDRQNLPGLFRTFDFANPDTSSQGRFRTTVPQQALFLLNSPFVADQARNLARRPEIESAATAAEKIARLYQVVLQRAPAKVELQEGEHFICAPAPTEPSQLTPLERYAQVLLCSNELMFLD